jgi:hypothetical protein
VVRGYQWGHDGGLPVSATGGSGSIYVVVHKSKYSLKPKKESSADSYSNAFRFQNSCQSKG